MGLGALLIKEHLGISDREAVEQISENPSLQYFLGLMEYQDTPPLDPSLMTPFRKRFDKKMLIEINESIVQGARDEAAHQEVSTERNRDNDSDTDGDDLPSNNGKLIADATCTPADIAYPTDLSLVNEARDKSEEIIDAICPLHRYPPKASNLPSKGA